MKSVPTLCATATVVGASAVGLSFARPEHSLDASKKRKATRARVADANAMPSAVQTPPLTHISQSLSSPVARPGSRASRVPLAERTASDGRQHRRLERRMTSSDVALFSLDAPLNNRTPGDRMLDNGEGPTSGSRPNWIKRLSVISTSQGSSRNSSPGPLSPSVSCSNGSMAFSHDSSTAPMIGDRAPSPLPPNKLVKRSSSVRMQHDCHPHGSGSRLPSLRRPATSHQRSATLQRHSALMEMSLEHTPLESPPISLLPDEDVEYTQYFAAKVANEKVSSKKRNGSGAAKSIKRIFPDENHKPTLMLAKAVTTYTEEVDESSSQDGDSVFAVSRPSTPFGVAVSNGPTDDKPNVPGSVGLNSSSHVDSVEEGKPRRSFSITDFLNPGSSSRKQRASKLPGAKLTRRPSQRARSASVSVIGNRKSSSAHEEPVGSSHERRNLTDPIFSKSGISTSVRPGENGTLINAAHQPSPWPLPALPLGNMTKYTSNTSKPSDDRTRKSSASGRDHGPPSPGPVQSGRPSRHSVAHSEHASTLVGSDIENRALGSGDEDDADLQSDTAFDSLRTGATKSTSGNRGPRIETIFDESPPSKVKVTALRDLLPKGTFREHTIDVTTGNHSIAEEEESISTPVRTIIPEKAGTNSSSPPRTAGVPPFPALISSSPDMPKPLSLGTLEYDTRAEDDDAESGWSIDEDNDEEQWGDLEHSPALVGTTPLSLSRPSLRAFAAASGSKPYISQHHVVEHTDRDARSSIFDWSEQQPTDKSLGNRTPPRPSTVHGKKDADRRGSRPVGRRVTSGLHARSQSVPVVPDITGKRSTVVTNKFGTWGVGSKGVTEDWNEDFDFGDFEDVPAENGSALNQRIDGSAAMVVPKTIQEQQNNVLANIGLLKEWGLLIEELKEQRYRADNLGILYGTHAAMWEEVDAMIDLADQEADEHGIPRLSPPSTPGFDEDAFDDVSGSSPTNGRGRRKTSPLASDEPNNKSPQAHSNHERPQRRSILPPNHEIFGPASSPLPLSAARAPVITTRPRKDSEAKAQSIIEALQKRKSMHDPNMDLQLAPATEKVPFDTATLRRIVPYVSGLTRRVKDAVRQAEGLYSSPSTSPKEPPFSRIFQTDNDLATQMKLMTVI